MMWLLHRVGEALFVAAGMFWQVGWSLVLGFLLSGIVQATVSKERMQRALGRNGFREIALATLYGAASSSCSYAAAALSKSLFKKGAGFIPSLAFLFASTNLVIELGIILYVLMGWQFTVAEWVGGVLLIAIMSLLVVATYPSKLVEEARRHLDEVSGHDHGGSGGTLVAVAQNFAMDWSMLWKDLLAGFLIAGALAVFVPSQLWQTIFLVHAPQWAQLVGNALLGPLIAIISFVCSIGNVPLAAVLWSNGIGFSGVLAFLYGDLIVLPLLDIYRRYYGWKMALYIGGIFYATMSASAIVMALVFRDLHLVPHQLRAATQAAPFSLNYTFYLNIAFGAIAAYLWWVNRRSPMPEHACHE